MTWSLHRAQLLVVRVGRVARRREHEPPHLLGMLDGEAERDASAERVAEDIDLLVAKAVEDCRRVIALIDDADRALAKLGAAVTVEIDRDHLARLRERWQYRAEHLDRSEPAVQQEERLALAANLVVVADAIDGHVALARNSRGRRGGGGRSGRRLLHGGLLAARTRGGDERRQDEEFRLHVETTNEPRADRQRSSLFRQVRIIARVSVSSDGEACRDCGPDRSPRCSRPRSRARRSRRHLRSAARSPAAH